MFMRAVADLVGDFTTKELGRMAVFKLLIYIHF